VKRSIASAPLLLVALALAACAPTPPPGATPADPRPTPPSTATPIPVPTETLAPEEVDPLAAVTRILLQTETAWFCDDVACGIDGFRYDEDPDAAIAKLTVLFGFEPTAESYDGYAGSTSYAYWWGDDVLLYFSTGDSPEIDHLVRVQVTTASVGGIAIETEGGVRVGTPWAAAAAAADSVREASGETDDGVMEAWFDTRPTDRPNTFDAILAFGNAGGTGPVSTLVGPITTGELPD
jgi:hypothetical protein